MTLSRTLRLLLAAVLLSVWQGALVHPLQHVDMDGQLVHLTDAHGPEGTGKHKGRDLLCDSIAAVAVCIGGSHALAVDTGAPLDSMVIGASGPAGVAAPLAYRSQAPPAVLL